VHDEIVRCVDSGDVCALVLLDLSAAFDMVDHQTHFFASLVTVSESKMQHLTGVSRTSL